MEFAARLTRSHAISTKTRHLFEKRARTAQERFQERMRKAWEREMADASADPPAPWTLWNDWCRYGLDVAQRSILFWDTLRQRGDNYLEHVRQGQPPLLHFEHETVLDGRTFARPVNYALLRILPPAGMEADPRQRPYLIIDPRAGHGPGIGGFKDDSEVGVILRERHPVYFVAFFRLPEPGQSLLDVCAAEQVFVRKVRELHPDSPKPALVGNCQGGWATMMLAATDPDSAGPVVINGAPMSYWGGAWREGEGDNPMRYAGGLLGGTWLASLASDLGNGLFDGAHLVENFENLNPANTYWDKYYHLFANIDGEPPRFLEFERWWGGYFLMNREEIEWITRNLFVGNRLWSGETGAGRGKPVFDLRDIKSPIVLFASLGDNITPPQQAFNWVADIYASTEEIKARGQIIVGLLHQDIGHLGIFVSGRVARKEHAQIVSVLKSIEMLPPGLYGMAIHERPGAGGKLEYEVEFHEHRLEDVSARLNRLQRVDEKPFEAVAALSEFNQRGYELFLRPLVRLMASERSAELMRQLHPLRLQRWAFSARNPWLWWLAPAAAAVRKQRQAPVASRDDLPHHGERLASELISASLDHYRALRDAAGEALFFQTYGSLFSLILDESPPPAASAEAQELPFVQEALDAIGEGGYDEAFARVAALLARKDELSLARLVTKQEIVRDYADLLPRLPPETWRRIRGEQEIIVNYAREQALATLPALLAGPAERERLLTLLERLAADERVRRSEPSAEQRAMLERIHDVLGRAPAVGQPTARSA
ncbi:MULTISPECIES: DUF3141 domain-containing protein [Azotobacter]|nr:DUF3141 domain-containing protein [Azotobacter vinelandii]WKN21286.1 DUF3141 domain-containing protein [Azotobacter vinelandii]GLK58565.1 hypothetical protein GCM10017624_07220 [Azotobacter vinelandii]SFX36217.1 Protein of unknown function [Azotobacter vinelandii]